MASNRETLPARTDLTAWVTLFKNLAERMKEDEHITNQRNRIPGFIAPTPTYLAPTNAYQPPAAPAVTADAGDPMILDAMRPSR
jgi:hypothetical protein